MPRAKLIDAAGGGVGGFRRYLDELYAFLQVGNRRSVRVIGAGNQVTFHWLARREMVAALSPPQDVFALNGVSFQAPRASTRVVLLRNALHFLGERESAEYAQATQWERQGKLVRLCARRSDRVVVPSYSMAERVISRMPSLSSRLEVLHHPVSHSSELTRHCPLPDSSLEVRILCSSLPHFYKDYTSRLQELLSVLPLLETETRRRWRLDVTTTSQHLSSMGFRGEASGFINFVGIVSPTRVRQLMQRATMLFFPSRIESFGYPLAEARVHRIPVVAPASDIAKEIAGPALYSYQPGSIEALMAALLQALTQPVPASPRDLFDPLRYFGELLGLGG